MNPRAKGLSLGKLCTSVFFLVQIAVFLRPAIAMKAVVVGATGAVGREIVGQLLCSDKWEKVTTVGRRALTVPDAYPEEKWKGTLEQTVVNMDNMREEAKGAFESADSVFCALGTTRAVAGSADNFRKVDLDYVEAAADVAKSQGSKHFSLVSAQGANAKIPASDFKLFHALLYAKVKGQAEAAVIDKGFERTSIFRPGLLARGSEARGIEKLFQKVVTNVQCSSIARAMILDAERNIGASNPVSGTSIFEMAEIKKSGDATEGAQPPPWQKQEL
ncbi:hypothetical protein BSKO_09858 [Bryopsis sp. KO-2023]|nr:hypothetical protein BSKO_09858 [Bryopsis sp. KO-2023]